MRYSALARAQRHACRIDITVISDAAGPGLLDTERVPRSPVARASLALALPVCLVVTLAGLAPSARAATDITVSTCDDSHLRAAVAQANSDNADDMILFACSGTISLTSTLDITGSMFLNAAGAQVTLDGGSAMGVLNVASGVTLKMTDLCVQNGSATVDGGALYNAGTANIYGGTFP